MRIVHRLVVLVLVSSVVAAALVLAASGETGRGDGLRAGRMAPAALAGITGESGRRDVHLILYSTECSWCTRQLAALAAAEPPRRPVIVVVLLESGDARDPVLAVPPWVRVVSASRDGLERAAGPIVTPTHLVLDASGRIVVSARGFRSPELLRQLDAMEIE